jgi:hypothetical protein
MKRLDALALVIALVALGLAVYDHMQVKSQMAVLGPFGFGTPTVVLADDLGTRSCYVVAKTGVVHAQSDQNIHWIVVNGCLSTPSVDLVNFSPSDPLDPTTPKSINGPVGSLLLHVLKTATPGTYHFQFSINGVAQTDPDIVIDNFNNR